ncbi:MAG TPA: hypothetical protein DIT25_04075 [Candidatus Moranbacteria bacterium]|nr:hypothetical protein [Candidatus Moranbacteria bacterium]
MENKIALFEGQKIRRQWDDEKERWYFSVVDVVRALTNSIDAGAYWRKLKQRLKEDGSEVVTKCHELKFMAKDGKYYISDSADTEAMLRIIQTIPSPKAEPFKLWLAKVGYERIQETADPELSINRARENWKKHGRSSEWIQRRMMGQETRNKLTDYWSEHKITKREEYAILTNIIHQEWSELSVSQHKKMKNLKRENLRDHMSDAELIFTALAELSSREIADSKNANGFEENKIAGQKGGGIARRARKDYEIETGKKVVNNKKFIISKSSTKLK